MYRVNQQVQSLFLTLHLLVDSIGKKRRMGFGDFPVLRFVVQDKRYTFAQRKFYNIIIYVQDKDLWRTTALR